jgi:hypothetical protein
VEIAVLRGHDSFVRSAPFSPDGSRIVTASEPFRVWGHAWEGEGAQKEPPPPAPLCLLGMQQMGNPVPSPKPNGALC